MNKHFNKILLPILLFLIAPVASAHTMWLESKTTGTVGKAHRVELFFGEFSMSDKTPTKGWLEGLWSGDFKVTTPSGTVIDLKAEAEEICYAATFTPTEEGWYRVHYDCFSPTNWQGSELHYLSVFWIKVGNPKLGPVEKSPFAGGLSLLPPTYGEADGKQVIKFPVLVNNEAPKRIALNILADNGWRKNYYRLNEGNLEMLPLWKGRYLLNEVIRKTYTAEESAARGGAKGLYSNITYFFEV
ncbi:MAG: hypothetical protein Q3998_02615 [Porphyromonas sp.]|nr:hypothetical protein [Porphyromonas sp.]